MTLDVKNMIVNYANELYSCGNCHKYPIHLVVMWNNGRRILSLFYSEMKVTNEADLQCPYCDSTDVHFQKVYKCNERGVIE